MKFALRKIGVVLVAVCGAGLAQTPKMTTVPLQFCQGLPCVEAELGNGQQVRLLLDTGNQATIVDTGVATRLGLKTTPLLGRNGKPVAGYERSTLPNLRLGGLALGDLHIAVSDLASYMKKNEMPKADGTLAYTAFQDRLVEIDYAHQQLRVSAPLTSEVACAGNCGQLQLITFGQYGPPIVVGSGFSVNGQPIRAQIDTLYSGSMLIYPTAVAKLHLEKEAQGGSKQFFPYTDGGVTMLRARAASEGFGGRSLARNAPLYFATPGVHVPDGMFEGTVGAALLAHRVLRLDFHDHWVAIAG
ncbi:MAG TPA: retropepsin-like aspartic protease [Terriglobales bacterium]|nr:retropepsin-like aspartic protease [Terriglobales bacterium]